MDHDRHPVLICRAANVFEFLDVVGIAQLHIGVAKVELNAAAKGGRPGTALQLLQCIVLEWIEPAKRTQTVRVLRCLSCIPVVLRPYLGVSSCTVRFGLP